MNKKLFIEFIFLIFLGMVTSLSLPPLNYFILNYFTYSLFFVFLFKKSNLHSNKKLFFFYGWLFGFGFFITNLYWVSISLSFDQTFDYLIPFLFVLLPTILSFFYGLISYFFINLRQKRIITSFLIFCILFGVIDFIRGSVFTGFPWNLIAYSFSNQLEILSITSVIGTYGFNLFCITLFTSPAFFILKGTKKDMGICIFILITPILFFLYGSNYKQKFNAAEKVKYEYKIRAIGSNISLNRFYTNVNSENIIEELIDISSPILNEKTIFLWPEGILPNISRNDLIEYEFLFNNSFSKNHLLMMGINGTSTLGDSIKYYNTFSVYDNKLNLLDTYNKVNLVPFGEFLPFESFLSNFGFKTVTNNYQSFSSGDKRNIINIKQENFYLKILPLICYEIIYSGKIFDHPNFDIIINISEDGWFGQSIGPKQHFVHNIFRAIESGKYVVRSSNNGMAAIINPVGIIEQKIDYNKSGYIDFIESKEIKMTIFSKFGNKIFGLLILLYIFLIFSFNKMSHE